MWLSQTGENLSQQSFAEASLRRVWSRLVGDRMFGLMWLFVGLVAVYDTCLLIRHRLVILEQELTPIAAMLIRTNGGDVSLLVIAKTIGTIVVLATLIVMHRVNRARANRVSFGNALFQFALLLMLTA
jgi:hypothetical protein